MNDNTYENIMILLNKISNFSKSAKPRLKLWNMDTSIYKTIERFKKKLDSIKTRKFNDYKRKQLIIRKEGLNKKGNPLYSFNFDGMNVTPINNNKGVAAESTKNQYLEVLTFFDLLNKNTLQNLNLTEYGFTLEFINFIYSDNIDEWWSLDKIVNFIKNGINSSNEAYKRLISSFLICLIYYLDEEHKILKNDTFEISFTRNKSTKNNKKYENSNLGRIKKTMDQTFLGLIKLTKELILRELNNDSKSNDNYEILNHFLKYVDASLYLLIDNEMENLELEQEEFRFYKMVENFRRRLRNKILTTRNPNNDLHYSDIEPIDSKIEFEHDAIEQQEAAHIYAVKEIRKLKGSILDRDICSQLEDPNNGILIDYIYHDAYDRNWLSLELDGHFEPQEEWTKHYPNSSKYPIMKIKDKVYNEMMKKYIQKMKNTK